MEDFADMGPFLANINKPHFYDIKSTYESKVESCYMQITEVETEYIPALMAKAVSVRWHCYTCNTSGRRYVTITDEAMVYYTTNAIMLDVAKACGDGHVNANVYAMANQIMGFLSHNTKMYNPAVKVAPDNDLANDLATIARSLPGVDYRWSKGCPDCGIPKRTVSDVIIHLNDFHMWTREKIADWLDEISDPTGENGPNISF